MFDHLLCVHVIDCSAVTVNVRAHIHKRRDLPSMCHRTNLPVWNWSGKFQKLSAVIECVYGQYILSLFLRLRPRAITLEDQHNMY